MAKLVNLIIYQTTKWHTIKILALIMEKIACSIWS